MNIMNGVSKIARSGFGRALKKSETKPAPQIEDSVFDYVKDSDSEFFTVGFGKSSILPPDLDKKKYYIAGYGENNPAQGAYDTPYAHAVWIDDNTGRGGIVFVSLDVVGFLNKDVNKLRDYMSEFCRKSGCRSFNVCVTHNHAGIDTMGIWGKLPKSGKDSSYMRIIFNAVKKAVYDAYRDRKAGKLYYGKIEVPDMQEDIRLPIVYSKMLTRLRFVPNDGSREIYILNFASHSESLQGVNHHVSADFPAYLREKILKEKGAETIYFVGAIGGMISMNIPDEQQIRQSGGNFLESTKRIGRQLADYAIAIKNETEVKPKINLIRQEFYAEGDNTVLMLAAKIGILSCDRYYVPWASMGQALKTELSYFEIGDELKLLMVPCEIFPELVFGGYLSAEESGTGNGPETNPTPLAEIAKDENLLIFGLANDEIGYVLPPNDFLLDKEAPYFEIPRDHLNRRHYEETNSLGPKTAQSIADTFKNMIEKVNEAKKTD